MHTLTKKEQRSVILALTIGTMLEWYEIYLYIFWAPIISKLFFNSSSNLMALINTFLIFAIGFLIRPIGGIVFGRLGDTIGRKKSLIISIVMMTIPTFMIGLLPTYSQIGLMAPFLLAFLRLFQSFPVGGEQPGVFCFLYECAYESNRRYMSSWGAVGNQIGIIFSMIECFLLEKFLTYEQLVSFGWRISFAVGGLIGLAAFYLRYKLHETPLFESLQEHHRIPKIGLLDVLYHHRKGITMAISFCVLDAAAFYLLSTLFPTFFINLFGSDHTKNLIITILFILLTTVPLPLFGLIGDRINNKLMLIGSTIIMIVLLFCLYFVYDTDKYAWITILSLLLTFFLTCLTALIPFLLAHYFPTGVRFTCVGFSFNIVDGIVGGFTPVIALLLCKITGSYASFCWFLIACALISLTAFIKMKEPYHEEHKG